MKGIFRVLGGLLLLAASQAFAAPFAYIPLAGEDKVAVVDLATNTLVTKVAAGTSPEAIAFSAGGGRVYVASATDGTLTTINAATNAPSTVNVGTLPVGVDASSLGQVAVATEGGATNGGAGTIAILTSAGVTPVAVGSAPVAVAYSPAGDKLYVANLADATISTVDTARLVAVDTTHVDTRPAGLVMDPSGKRLFVMHQAFLQVGSNEITVLDISGSPRTTAIIPLTGAPEWMALHPDGNLLAVAKPLTQSVSIVDIAAGKVALDIQLALGSSPSGVSFSNDGTRLYVLNAQGGGTMEVYDTATWQRVATVTVGAGPSARGIFVPPAAATNHPGPLSGLWWNPSESGWGINFTQRSGNILATWFTYDGNGKAKWYAVPNCAIGTGHSCSGTVYQVTGPLFFAVAQYDPTLRNTTSVGSFSVDFSDNDHASMTYTVNGVSRTVAIQREMFDTDMSLPNPWVTAYTDMWWNPAEPGWGLALTQQNGTVVALWYVYDVNGNPDWFIAPNCEVDRATQTTCGGQLYHTSGPNFGTSFDPAAVATEIAGYLRITWTDASHATIDGVAYGSASHKTVTRELF